VFILEEPYVSDLLATTVAELGQAVLDTPIAARRLPKACAHLIRDDQTFAAAAGCSGARLYSNSENALRWISQHMAHSDLPRAIGLLKDKVRFRDLVADLYPDYRYVGLSFDELLAFDPAGLRVPFIVKPAVGFFSLGVHVVESLADWPGLVTEIEREAKALRLLYPAQVLDFERYVVEEIIEGEEFAVDAYYDADGQLVIINVYAHLFGSRTDVSDRVYLTNAETVTRFAPLAGGILAEIGRRAGLTNFPVHAELRIDSAGNVAPIEVNPMRFGGWCVTDLAHFAYGLNPYRCYIRCERPDWTRIARATDGRTTALIVSNLPNSVDLRSIKRVDYERFAARFSKVLELRPTDFNRYPVFAFTFVEVPCGDLSELRAVLGADLREYLTMGHVS
jgi:ATP-grasp domain